MRGPLPPAPEDPPAIAESRRALVDRLFSARGSALLAYLSTLLGGRQEATEFAQEVWARLLKGRTPEFIRDPEAYLFSIARNLVRKHASQRSRRGTAVGVDDPTIQAELAEFPDFDEDIDEVQQQRSVEQVLRKLPRQQRLAVELKYWKGLSYEEIARELDVSTHAVKKSLSRALGNCRRLLAQLEKGMMNRPASRREVTKTAE